MSPPATSAAARSTPPSKRVRRSPTEARAEILRVAEDLLVADGPDAVRVQRVGAAIGITDAAVHYHFRSREQLLVALLDEIAKRLKHDVNSIAAEWDPDNIEMSELVGLLDDRYRRRSYARLTAWMSLSGWRPKGSGLFADQVATLHDARIRRARAEGRPAPDIEDSQHLIVLVNLVVWADALVGDDWRRAVGLPRTAKAATRFRHWFAAFVGHVDD
jgi:AcrR family transcriptional regulator